MIPGMTSQGDWLSQLIWFIIFFIFVMFAPRLMITQTIMKLEKDAEELEAYAKEAKEYVYKNIPMKAGKKTRENIDSFLEFFIIPPVNIDPYGVMKKLDHLMKNSDRKFKYFVDQVIPEATEVEKSNLKNGLAGAMQTYQIAKIVRHYLETIKKYKMFQMAMIIQMQIPMIKDIAKASKEATKAFIDQAPIGDSVGPLVVATMTKTKVIEFKEEEFTMSQTKVAGRTVYIAKARGPGASTGYPGKFLQKVVGKYRIGRIITVDAALKMEGEKTGSIAEGVGVAMGGIGVDRCEIEDIAVKKNLPLDAVAIKMSQEEALTHMSKDILNAVPNAIDAVENLVRNGGKKSILIIGVGNTVGIGGNYKDAQENMKAIKSSIKKRAEKKPL